MNRRKRWSLAGAGILLTGVMLLGGCNEPKQTNHPGGMPPDVQAEFNRRMQGGGVAPGQTAPGSGKDAGKDAGKAASPSGGGGK